MNTYIIDTGAICIPLNAESVKDALEFTLITSAFLKPGMYTVHQPNISIMSHDLIVCNIGDAEVRIYPKPPTLEVSSEAFYLTSPLVCIEH